jgi:ketosteroid isomerase-like protein
MRYFALGLLLATLPALRAADKISPAEQEELKSRTYALWTAWDSFDPSRVAKFYSKDPGNVYYDISPLKFTGWQQYAEVAGKNLAGAHAKWSPNGDDFKVIKSGDLAVTTMTMNLAFTSKASATTNMQVRVTDVWEKQGGKWLVVHEHASVPSR